MPTKNERTRLHATYSVAPAGYFNVLKPTGRFVSRLSGSFNELMGKSKRKFATPSSPLQGASVQLETTEVNFNRDLLVRIAIIAIAASAIMFAMVELLVRDP